MLSELTFQFDTAPGHLIRRAQQRHQALWAQIVGAELTSVQFAVLSLIEREPELDQRTLAERISVDTSTLVGVCRRLEQKGLMSRSRAGDDARRYVLRVTGDGGALLRRVTPDVVRVGDALLEGFSADERQALLSLLHRLI